MSGSCDEVYTKREVRIRKARKDHRCCACRQVIAVGHYYANVFTLFEREVTIYKRCGACQKTHEHLVALCDDHNRRHPYDNMWPQENLGCGLDYAEEWGEEPDDEIAALAFMSSAESGQLLAPKQAVTT